jgi:hypothetical protein
MKTTHSISRWFIAVALLTVGAPAARAVAAQPPEVELSSRAHPVLSAAAAQWLRTAKLADQRASEWKTKVEAYRAMGGAAYKGGLVQRAEGEVARYGREAARARALASGELTEAQIAEAQRYERLADEYRRMGGIAYKNGLVQWAEAQARKYAPLRGTS